MKPAPFKYFAPTSVAEALDTLNELGYAGKVLAGGQSLIPAMNFRMAQPSALVDINNIPELDFIKPMDNGSLAIGTMTRDSMVEYDPQAIKKFPIIAETMPHIAHPQIRNRGTFGGNVAHADPNGQLPGIVTVLDANLKIQNKTSERWVKADEFFLGPFTTVLQPEDLLTEIVLPPLPSRSGTCYMQVARQAGATTQVAVCTVVALDEKGFCKHARIVLLSVGETPLLVQQAAKMLIGHAPTTEGIRAAAEKAAKDEIDPGTDIHATADYRRHVASVLVRRSLTTAFERAKQSGG